MAYRADDRHGQSVHAISMEQLAVKTLLLGATAFSSWDVYEIGDSDPAYVGIITGGVFHPAGEAW